MSAHIVVISAVPELTEAARRALAGSVETALRGVERPSCPITSTTRLIGRDATVTAVTAALKAAAARLPFTDSRVVIYYNGHGDQVLDVSGDEADRRDEVWRLHGGTLSDDTITDILTSGPCAPSSVITLISDSCSSGTMIDARPQAHTNWVSFAACSDAQSAFASSDGGVFTLFGLVPTLRALAASAGGATPRALSDGVNARLSIPSQIVQLAFAPGRGAALAQTPIL